jgi:hypothetical protein
VAAGITTARALFTATPGASRSLSGFSLPNLGDDGQFTFLANYPGGCGVFVRRPWGDIEAVALKGHTVDGGRAALECGTETWISYGGTVAFLAVSRPLSPGGKRSQYDPGQPQDGRGAAGPQGRGRGDESAQG